MQSHARRSFESLCVTVDSFDVDGDGKLGIDEFCKAMVGLTGGDADDDGEIDEKEVDEWGEVEDEEY